MIKKRSCHLTSRHNPSPPHRTEGWGIEFFFFISIGSHFVDYTPQGESKFLVSLVQFRQSVENIINSSKSSSKSPCDIKLNIKSITTKNLYCLQQVLYKKASVRFLIWL